MALILGTSVARAQHYDRGYETVSSTVFAPKGTFMVGGNIRFSSHSMRDYSMLVINDINTNGCTFSASPTFLYMLRDNVGIGARFSYNRALLNIDSAKLSVSEISMSVDDYYKLSQSFSGVFLIRPYIPLGAGGRFSMFAEAQLGMTFAQSKNTVNVSNEIKGSFVEKYKLFFGVNPGFAALLTNHLAMELSVGLFGISYGWSDQAHNQVSQGATDATAASFMVNPAAISVGLSYYL